jgi:NitT/TauT family transport system permease protein
VTASSNRPPKPRLFGVHAQPAIWQRVLMGALPFILILVVYSLASDARLADNPNDKLLPSFQLMWDSMVPMVTEEDPRTGNYLLWHDTQASLTRLAIGVAAAFIVALWLGLNTGIFGGMAAIVNPALAFVAMIPPLALLPILFITLGIDELGKIALIFIGTFPAMTRDIYLSTRSLPVEQLTKTLTLGGGQLAYVYRIALPQILPRAIDTLRLSLGAAWLFLIAAEAIASTEGLGYRIFLVRRYLAMDVIIPYVVWITLLGFSIDYSLRVLRRRLYPWYQGDNAP